MTSIRSYNKRLEALRSERSTFITLYRDLSDYHLAHRGRFLTSDRNKGHKRNTRQYNNTSKMAARTLASGMMAGITSPARPWFKLQAPDPELNEYASVKGWLHQVQATMYRVFSQSNTYNALHTLYSELGVFGTAPMGVYQDFENVIRCVPYTVGSYMVSANGKGEIDTFYREYEMTVAQVVREFGLENCSKSVQDNWKSGNTEHWVKIIRVVEPNDNRDNQSPLAKDKAYRAVYYEHDNPRCLEENKFLRRSGHDDFPILCPRWDITGEDIYAVDCPGITALGDAKALQLGEKRKYQAIDKLVNPPLQGDATLRSKMSKGGLNPGDIIWQDQQGQGLTSIYQNYRPDVNAIMMINKESEDRIKRAFYEDLFLMMANSDRRQITAREIAEKQEEKLLMLGPVLERLHSELLDPLIDRTFDILQGAGVLPLPPRELQGVELKVEYVSILAQAQRMVAVGGIERLTNFTGQIAQVWPEARHKVDPMQAVDEYAEALGVNPRIVKADEEAQAVMQAEAEAAQQAAAQQQGQQLAETAKTVSETDVQEGALAEMMTQAGLL